MFAARPVGPGFSPLDEELGLLPGALTPTLQGHLSRLGSQLSFAAAARELGYLKGVRVAATTARRRTEADGAVYAARQAAEAARVLAEAPLPPLGPPVQQVSVDGAMVGLVDGSWREVRTLAIGTIVPDRTPGLVRSVELSYFSRLCTAEQFILAATGEMHRRGVETAGQVAFVVDGAEWEQRFADAHCPTATRILDLPHAAQRLTDVAEAVWGTHTLGRTWAAAQRQALREGPAEAVLEAIRALPLAAAPDPVAARDLQSTVLGYLEPRVEQMRYAAFRALGLPIGSGIVESANKHVVAARLKGTGMRWSEAAITPMLALCGALSSERWEEAWTQITHSRRQSRRRALPPPSSVPTPAASAASVGPARPSIRQPPSAAIPRSGPKSIIDGRPTAAHPWKRGFPRQTAAPAKLCSAPRGAQSVRL
ncbi:MAG TPA: hypothetical protein VK883_02815 [Arthrobacter sp.]|nr:hypothetical protein [Arthrobacter sp.]